MSDKINGRTPEEIKRGLECCATLEPINQPCGECSYAEINFGVCSNFVCADTLALIQQLEADLAEARKDIDMLGEQAVALDSAYEAMKRERDAAVEDLKNKFFGCHTCKHLEYSPDGTRGCCTLPLEKRKPSFECYEWRGVQEVE